MQSRSPDPAGWRRGLRTSARVAVATAFVIIGGCADMERRYREGPTWHADNEAMKRDLERQGFPQYSPPL